MAFFGNYPSQDDGQVDQSFEESGMTEVRRLPDDFRKRSVDQAVAPVESMPQNAADQVLGPLDVESPPSPSQVLLAGPLFTTVDAHLVEGELAASRALSDERIEEAATRTLPVDIEKLYRRLQRSVARAKSMPINQFQSQLKREWLRAEDYFQWKLWDVQEELVHPEPGNPYRSVITAGDIQAHITTFVRRRWQVQGIWAKDWGCWYGEIPALGYKPRNPILQGLVKPKHFRPETIAAYSGDLWGHEGLDAPQPGRGPKRRSGWESMGGFQAQSTVPSVRDPEASRPLAQFRYQMAKERERLKDVMGSKALGNDADLDALAFLSVKDSWKEDGIWSPNWGEVPGSTWWHEDPDDEEDKEEEVPEGVDRSHLREIQDILTRNADIQFPVR